MSHFTVIVIGDDYEGQLAPYNENLDTTFESVKQEYLEKWETGVTELVQMPDGELLYPFDKRFARPKESFLDRQEYDIPTNCTVSERPFKDKYGTFEEFMKDYAGYTPTAEGDYGHWGNPDGKWDWYQVGGRWTGYFPLTPTAPGRLGAPGVFGTPAQPGTADVVKLQDVDIARARREAREEAISTFAKWEALFTKHGKPRSWASIRDDDSVPDTDAKRKLYCSQGAIQNYEDKWDCPVDAIGFDKEAYIKRRENRALVPYAFVKNGKWFGKGDMGWWGMSDDKFTQDDWNREFHRMLSDLPPDTQLTLVDCHT